ncbi:aminopeptidase P N-terminal domain-containing protein [Noviherbaspirillum suwonense]|uniref:Xaa-Pro aminopeptidase n=1 Tax=Noviherbaspirillum suwonense TaxID=1224511 RepID=A0ABY1QH11_9BURK|nr:aminopeptidase P N-terminal domain-containing protein [Noviherbaspirillum suwonense]SMP67571.1 aminopeptidase P Metallo peptidase. MEROPS family M24B [Noviherbaspirillum suwonense]
MTEAYAARRARLIEQMQARGGGIAVIPTAPEALRNNDADFPYRHDSYFYYLTGFTEPEAVLVLVANAAGGQSILFCREKNMEREIWDGYRYGPDAAREQFGLDAAHPVAALDTEVPKLMANAPAIFYALGSNAKLDAQVQGWLQSVRAQVRAGVGAPSAAFDVNLLLDEMRLVKDAGEIAIMRRAALISSAAHERAMRMSKPGLREYQVEAELLHEFRRNGSQFPAYTSIVATGANACVLHYRAGDAVLQDGDLVLIDAGCELDGYASDITRTYPASGRFSGPQKALYEIVLAAQAAAIAEIRPGKRFTDGHDAAVKVLAQGMLDTGLLDRGKVGTLDDVIANGDFRQFYMHRTGHWLGMDVHDVGEYRDPAPAGQEKPWRTLQPGMALTVEPGIYVRPADGVPEQFWNIGIRIEDDAVVTAGGCDIITAEAPKTVAEIEAVMRG